MIDEIRLTALRFWQYSEIPAIRGKAEVSLWQKQKTERLRRTKGTTTYFVGGKPPEAGIEPGTEVKSLRQGRCNLKDAWCSVVDGECS